MGLNRAMPLRKHFQGLLLGSYVGSCAGRQALNGLCRYPEMVDLHVENLASALLSPNLQDRLNDKLRSFANGEIPHAAHAVSAFYSVLVRYRISGIPPATDNPDTRAKSKCTWAEGSNCGTPSHQKSMNIALIQSMYRGSFFDMEYRVKKQRIPDGQLTPIYFSSTIFHDLKHKFDTRRSHSSYPVCINRPLVVVHFPNPRGGYGVDEDSDYEGEPILGFTEAGANGSTQEDSVPCLNFLPGAFTT